LKQEERRGVGPLYRFVNLVADTAKGKPFAPRLFPLYKKTRAELAELAHGGNPFAKQAKADLEAAWIEWGAHTTFELVKVFEPKMLISQVMKTDPSVYHQAFGSLLPTAVHDQFAEYLRNPHYLPAAETVEQQWMAEKELGGPRGELAKAVLVLLWLPCCVTEVDSVFSTFDSAFGDRRSSLTTANIQWRGLLAANKDVRGILGPSSGKGL